MYTYDTGLIRLRYTVTDTYRVVKSAGYTLNSSENEFKFMALQSWRVNSMNSYSTCRERTLSHELCGNAALCRRRRPGLKYCAASGRQARPHACTCRSPLSRSFLPPLLTARRAHSVVAHMRRGHRHCSCSFALSCVSIHTLLGDKSRHISAPGALPPSLNGRQTHSAVAE